MPSAQRGFVYVRAEYPIAVEHMSIALWQARERGLLGSTFLAAGSTSTWSCAWARARSSAAKKAP